MFLFRFETPDRLRAIGKTDLAPYPQTALGIPTVFRFDMANPEAQFLAQSFLLANKDALYVANAGSVQLGKLLALFNIGLSSAQRIEALGN